MANSPVGPMSVGSAYLSKHQLVPPQVGAPASGRLGLAIVIPCHDEPDLLRQIELAMEMGYRNFLLLTGDWLPDVERGVSQQTWFAVAR